MLLFLFSCFTISDKDWDDWSNTDFDNIKPSISDIQITGESEHFYNDETLTCSASVQDPDDEPIISYSWSLNQTEIGNSPLLDLTSITVEPLDSLTCMITATDSQNASAQASTTITIGNRPPSAPEVSISWDSPTYQPFTTDIITCLGENSEDPEGFPISYSYDWSSDAGVSIAGEFLSSSQTTEGEHWTCTVTAGDGISSSSSHTDIEIFTSLHWNNCPNTQNLGDGFYQFMGETEEDWAGNSIGGSGDVNGDGLSDILIGAKNNDEGGENAGKVYLILGSGLGPSTTGDLSQADYVFIGENNQDEAGYSLSFAGDVDGDGKDDILIGSMFNDDGGNSAGKIYLILGSSLQASSTIDLSDADYSFIGENGDDQAGRSVSSAGDVDGDGLDDILIGSAFNDDGGEYAGKVYLILASSLGVDSRIDLSQADYSFIGEAESDLAGQAVSSAGDVDNDGLDDILIGAYGNDERGEDAGKAYLILSSELGESSLIDLSSINYSFLGENAGDTLGHSLSAVSDINGDGKHDILIGAAGNDDGGEDAGKAYLILSSDLGDSSGHDLSQTAYSFLGENAGDAAGRSVSSAGDVDGDGLDDILISATHNDNGGNNAGKSYLILGSSLSSTSVIDLSQADYSFLGEQDGDRIGFPISSAGDINGDGKDDILISAYYSAENGNDAGKVSVFIGCE